MAYIERSLGEGEKLIRMAQFHWFHRARAWTVFTLFLCLALAPLVAYTAWWAFLMIAAIGFLFYLRLMIPIWTTEIGVTNQRLILKRGLLARHSDELELWAIEAVNLKQGIWGRILGYGRIEVQGTGDDSLSTPAINAPLLFRKTLQEAISQARPPGAADARELARAAAHRTQH
jgi:uncharacterized membrane protein YdbT with pleckstrin-like domain